jgi:biopolymer transport protein ExbD
MSRSHGEGVKSEPNLTPILDMVFQLITFFMLVINFKAAELDMTLKLPVVGSAQPVDTHGKDKLLVLNIQNAGHCSQDGCGALATMTGEKTGEGAEARYAMRCTKNHKTWSRAPYVSHGEVCLSLYGTLIPKDQIKSYLTREQTSSLMAAKPHLTVDDIQAGKELPDMVVLRSDEHTPFGHVYYIVTTCQELGYRSFALKAMKK